MKIRDIARNTKDIPVDAGNLEQELSSLPGNILVSQVSEDFLKTSSPVIMVVDEKGIQEGFVRREDLAFFSEHCRSGFPESVLDMLDVGIIAADRNGRIFYANHAYETLLGVPVHKVAGRNIYRIEPESDLCTALQTGKDITNKSKYIRSVDRYVSLKIHVFRDSSLPFPKDVALDTQNRIDGTIEKISETTSPLTGAVSFFTDVTKLETLNTEIERMSGMVDDFRRQLEDNYSRTGVITRDRGFLKLMEQASIAAGTDVPVLIRGENGVGKEVVARYIHKAGSRSKMPMVVVNCASIPESLIESELFGYEEGAFTGAKRGGRMGKFELANHGTIFLDEIGDMPAALQPRLLRVIQNGEIEKIGRQKTVPVDVRIIAATNQPLEEMIRKKMFREDLFFRLNVISLHIPPLRDRRDDIPLLADHFLREFCHKYKKEKEISFIGYQRLKAQNWSGNVRELQNCIERSVILTQDKVLDFKEYEATDSIPVDRGPSSQGSKNSSFRSASEETGEMRNNGPDAPTNGQYPGHGTASSILTEGFSLSAAMAQYERKLIQDILAQTDGSRPEAIRILGISRRSFYRKCAQYGIFHE